MKSSEQIAPSWSEWLANDPEGFRLYLESVLLKYRSGVKLTTSETKIITILSDAIFKSHKVAESGNGMSDNCDHAWIYAKGGRICLNCKKCE